MRRYVTIAAVCALAFHLLLGWMWSAGGAVIGAYFSPRKGIWVGTIGVCSAWTALLLFRYLQAPEQVTEMGRVVAALMGDLPLVSTFALTIGIGALLGAAGGAVGTYVAELLRTKR